MPNLAWQGVPHPAASITAAKIKYFPTTLFLHMVLMLLLLKRKNTPPPDSPQSHVHVNRGLKSALLQPTTDV
jgi:hypothetical protein